MATVRDPQFWKRFSVAVHQDEQAREEMANQPGIKHAYVVSTSPLPSPVTTPTSQTNLSPAFASTQTFETSQPLSPIALQHSAPLSQAPSQVLSSSSPHPSAPPTPKREPSRLKKPHPGSKEQLHKTPGKPANIHVQSFTKHNNSSILILGLSGRPQSRFKFWTSVTADPSNRDSWLESQRRKSKQRTWICWSFWICLALIVAAIVVTVLTLKAHNII